VVGIPPGRHSGRLPKLQTNGAIPICYYYYYFFIIYFIIINIIIIIIID